MLRKWTGLSQKDLAKRISTTGQQVGHLEAGRRKLPRIGCGAYPLALNVG